MTEPSAPARRPRIAYLSYSSAEFDSRTQRMVRSAIDRGYEVTVYARLEPGLPAVVDKGDHRIVRVALDLTLLAPGWLRPILRRRRSHSSGARITRPEAAPSNVAGSARAVEPAAAPPPAAGPSGVLDAASTLGQPTRRGPRTILLETRAAPAVRLGMAILRAPGRWWRHAITFPLRPMAWAAALDAATEPADLWHGMWAGSLPALSRLRARHGGRTIYDSRDVYLHARFFGQMSRFRRWLYQRLERHWAHAADTVITVNDAYADLLTGLLAIPRPEVVMNCPVTWQPPSPPPDRIRERLGIPSETAIVLYQGNLMTERGIEEGLVAIQAVPGAAFVILGYGALRHQIAAAVSRPPLAGRAFLIDAVPPSELLLWSASADILLMAIQPTTINHRFTTPQKLFEALAAGVPVVASDLPGMADIVRATGAGVVCDPTSPAAIASAIRSILEASPEDRARLRERALAAAHDRYNWERQTDVLFAVYDRLLGGPPPLAATAIAREGGSERRRLEAADA